MNRSIPPPIFYVLSLFLVTSCKVYKQDIMFQAEEDALSIQQSVNFAERNYLIQVDDLLRIDVFTNDGERIIDPNFELQQNIPQQIQNQRRFNYLVQIDGEIKLPMIGKIPIAGLTIDEAEKKLERLFDKFYKNSFVKLAFENKRVVVLGGVNGGQLIPLTNQNMTLVEVIALAGGVNFGSKAHNIRLIRGKLSNPTVFQINLSTIDGMKQSIVPVEPGDIIYVEPWRRPFFEGFKDVAPILSTTTAITSSVVAIILLIRSL